MGKPSYGKAQLLKGLVTGRPRYGKPKVREGRVTKGILTEKTELQDDGKG